MRRKQHACSIKHVSQVLSSCLLEGFVRQRVLEGRKNIMTRNMLQMSVQTGKRKRIGAVRKLGAMADVRERRLDRGKEREEATNGELRTVFFGLLHYFSKASTAPEDGNGCGCEQLKDVCQKESKWKTKSCKMSQRMRQMLLPT